MLWSMGWQRVGHDWATELNCPFIHIIVDDFKSISYSLSHKHLPCSSWAWGLAVRFQSGYRSRQGQEACVSCSFCRRGGGCRGELRTGLYSHSSRGEQAWLPRWDLWSDTLTTLSGLKEVLPSFSELPNRRRYQTVTYLQNFKPNY